MIDTHIINDSFDKTGKVINGTESELDTDGSMLVSHSILLGFSIVYIILGTFGNTVSLVILSRAALRHDPLSSLFRFQAGLDLLITLTVIPKYLAMAFIDFSSSHTFFNTDSILCRLYASYSMASAALSNWIVVCIALLRWKLVENVMTLRPVVTHRQIRVFVVVLGCFSAFVFIFLFSLFGSYGELGSLFYVMCKHPRSEQNLAEAIIVLPMVHFPCCLVVLFNSLTIVSYNRLKTKEQLLVQAKAALASRAEALETQIGSVKPVVNKSILKLEGMNPFLTRSEMHLEAGPKSVSFAEVNVEQISYDDQDIYEELFEGDTDSIAESFDSDLIDRNAPSGMRYFEWKSQDSAYSRLITRYLKKKIRTLRQVERRYKDISRKLRIMQTQCNWVQHSGKVGIFPRGSSRMSTRENSTSSIFSQPSNLGPTTYCLPSISTQNLAIAAITFFLIHYMPFFYLHLQDLLASRSETYQSKRDKTLDSIATMMRYGTNALSFIVYTFLYLPFQLEIQKATFIGQDPPPNSYEKLYPLSMKRSEKNGVKTAAKKLLMQSANKQLYHREVQWTA